MPFRDRLLLGQIAVVDRMKVLGQTIARRARRVRSDEQGQTPTEYLMIVGLMAAVIVLVFVTFYWGTVRDAASTWAAKVKTAITGGGIQ